MEGRRMSSIDTKTSRPHSTPGSGPFVVAIDGPGGSGKSTVAREVARRLGWHLLDTGSAYRALTWYGLQRHVDLSDPAAVTALLPGFLDSWELALEPDERWVRVAGVDVTDAIRETSISAAVSQVARILPVREAVNRRFRQLLFEDTAPGIIAEGRDITTVVAPDAPLRILLTADERVRIARRQAEKIGEDAGEVASTITDRDAKDSQVVDFLHAADGVELVDSTHLDLEGTIQAVLDLITAGRAARTDGATAPGKDTP